MIFQIFVRFRHSVCVCVCLCAVTTWAGWAMMQLSSRRKLHHPPCNSASWLVWIFWATNSEWVWSVNLMSLQYGTCWRGLNPFW
jgi:hypothetical protein